MYRIEVIAELEYPSPPAPMGYTEGEEPGSNILRAPGKPAGGSRCKFCTLKV